MGKTHCHDLGQPCSVAVFSSKCTPENIECLRGICRYLPDPCRPCWYCNVLMVCISATFARPLSILLTLQCIGNRFRRHLDAAYNTFCWYIRGFRLNFMPTYVAKMYHTDIRLRCEVKVVPRLERDDMYHTWTG